MYIYVFVYVYVYRCLLDKSEWLHVSSAGLDGTELRIEEKSVLERPVCLICI